MTVCASSQVPSRQVQLSSRLYLFHVRVQAKQLKTPPKKQKQNNSLILTLKLLNVS